MLMVKMRTMVIMMANISTIMMKVIDNVYTSSREETDLKRGRFESLALLQQLQLDTSLHLKCALFNMHLS